MMVADPPWFFDKLNLLHCSSLAIVNVVEHQESDSFVPFDWLKRLEAHRDRFRPDVKVEDPELGCCLKARRHARCQGDLGSVFAVYTETDDSVR